METIQIIVKTSEEAEALKKLLKTMSFVESVSTIDNDTESEAWLSFSMENFAAMYDEAEGGSNEPEYSLANYLIKQDDFKD